MNVHMMSVGPFQSNCFVVQCKETRDAIVVDAGADAERIISTIRKLGVTVKAIVNTHAHIDHVSGLSEVVGEFSVPVLMHERELPVYESVPDQARMFGLPVPKLVDISRYIVEGDSVKFGRCEGVVRETPGHSPGGISLLFADANPPCVFVGDVLFMGSIGRTDLMGANHDVMMRTLRNIVLSWPDDMVVHSGHGPSTTIGIERRSNPFLLQLRHGDV